MFTDEETAVLSGHIPCTKMPRWQMAGWEVTPRLVLLKVCAFICHLLIPMLVLWPEVKRRQTIHNHWLDAVGPQILGGNKINGIYMSLHAFMLKEFFLVVSYAESSVVLYL